MASSGPAVSVILPVYNAVDYLDEALRSISAQTFENFEVVVVDDGSTDGSTGLLTAHARSDRRFRVLRQPNRGGAAARNRAVEEARAPLIALADADDVLYPDRLGLQFERLAQDPGLVVLGGAADLLDEHGTLIGHDDVPVGHDRIVRHLLTIGSCLYDPSVMMRRAAFEAVGGYRSKLTLAYDYDLWLRLLPGRFDNLADTVIGYRVHGQQTTSRGWMLATLSEVVLRSSYRARAAGLADPVDAWDGGLNLDVVPTLQLSTRQEYGLYVNLFTAALDAPVGSDRDLLPGSVLRQRLVQTSRRLRPGRGVDDLGSSLRLVRRCWSGDERTLALGLAARMWRAAPTEMSTWLVQRVVTLLRTNAPRIAGQAGVRRRQ